MPQETYAKVTINLRNMHYIDIFQDDLIDKGIHKYI